MSTYLLQLSEKDLDAIVQAKVDAAMQKLTAQLEAVNALPVRLTCVGAAKAMGVSVRKFHDDFKHLKRHDGNSVYVAREDILQFKMKQRNG